MMDIFKIDLYSLSSFELSYLWSQYYWAGEYGIAGDIEEVWRYLYPEDFE